MVGVDGVHLLEYTLSHSLWLIGKPTAIRGFVTNGGYAGAPTEERLFDVVVAATDVPGIQKILPSSFRTHYAEFDNIYQLSAVPVVTVQLRFNGWVTELQDPIKMKQLNGDLSNGRYTFCS